jgi:hypothetical protein
MKLFIRKRLASVLTLVLLTLAVAPARAQSTILFSNLPGNNTSSTVRTSNFAAMGITMGDTAFTLDAVTLALQIKSDAFYLNLYSDNGGNPGSLLTALSPTMSFEPTPIGTYTNYTFTPDSSFTLLAGETYWFVASGGGTSTTTAPAWEITRTTPTIASGITFAGLRSTSNGGATWSSPNAQVTLQIEGTIAPVPEPSTIALSVAGGFALLAGYRRHRSK